MSLALTTDCYWQVKFPRGGFFDMQCVANFSLLFYEVCCSMTQPHLYPHRINRMTNRPRLIARALRHPAMACHRSVTKSLAQGSTRSATQAAGDGELHMRGRGSLAIECR